MRLNERGATLAVVLLVIIVFSVLGLAVMGGVVNENKRVNVTESDVQARYMAENGLTYFETEFSNYIKNTDNVSFDFSGFFSNYKNFKSVGEASNPAEAQIMAKMDSNDNITVTSIGRFGSITKTLIGYYKLSFDDVIKSPSFDMMKFDKDGTIPIDFSKTSAAYLNLLNLIKLDVLNLTGTNQYYPVPTDSVLSVNVLGSILGINLSGGNSFETMKDYRVIASNDGKVLGINLLNTPIDLMSYQGASDLNVIIDGFVPGVSLLGIPIISDYKNIDFKKLAVMGNTIIQTATSSARRFTFAEGLYVNKSLIIGNSSSRSNLTLQGNMVTMKDLTIYKADLTYSGNSNLYVWGNAAVNNSTITVSDPQNAFCLLAMGTITINNSKANNEYDGLFYSPSGITINTNGYPMTIKGGIIGNYHVDYPDKLTVITDPQYLNKVNLTNIKLVPQGRALQ